MCDNQFTAPGVFVFSTATDAVIAGPLNTGLPPNQITFDHASDPVAGVTQAGFPVSFSAPWPNPARSEARFALTLAHAGRVRIDVLDPSGRRVRVLDPGDRPAGSSEATWDLRDGAGRKVGPGLYLVRAKLGGSYTVRRLIVLR